jgi:golgi phosphoprotein 3
MLSLGESLVLLALDDEQGTVGWFSEDALNFGLAGALLADLAVRQRIAITGRTVTALDTTPVGEPLLDETLALVTGSTKARDARGWVTEVAYHVKHVRERLCDGLVTQGVLRHEEHTTLLVFRRTRYPSGDPGPEHALRAELQSAASAPPPLEPRPLILLSLARACDMLDQLLGKDARKHAAALVKDEPWGDAVRKVIRARRAALGASSGGGLVVVQH